MKNKILILIVFISVISKLTICQTLPLKQRQINALNGTQIISMLSPLNLTDREDSIFNGVISGNVPDFLRQLIPINVTTNISGTNHTILYYVIPDYMALGCDSDYFLCPMTPLLAQKIADYIGFTLPTRKMVNDIWQTATVKLSPQTISPSPQMTTVPVFATHDSMVYSQRSTYIISNPLGELVAGDKKDVVISNHIYGNPAPGRVVIYGWHYQSGTPIQPLYWGHEETYADYSHGIRLVQNDALVDGCLTKLTDIMQSPTLNPLVSDESAINITRYPITENIIPTPNSFCVLCNGLGSIKIKIKQNPQIYAYNVSFSHDGKCFELPTKNNSNVITINNLNIDTIFYVKLAAIGANGYVSDYSEVLGACTTDTTYLGHYLIINSFDRNTTGNTHDFIRQHGSSIKNIGKYFSSVTNEGVTDSLVYLNNFDALDYILGEESSVNETFTAQEQSLLENCTKPYFISGSEIGWDLDYLGNTTDKSFYHNYLFANYLEDAPNNQPSTYYNATFANPLGNQISFNYDDGTHGTYDVRYPDVITPNTIGNYQGENIAYFNDFPSKSAGTYFLNKMVYLTIPFETIYPELKRDEIMNEINNILFAPNYVNINEDNSFSIYPNPCKESLFINSNDLLNSNYILKINSSDGKTILTKYLNKNNYTEKIDLNNISNGIYIITIYNNDSFYRSKIVVSK